MWARVVEIMLGCWMAMSPFVFRHPSDARHLWAIDFASGAVIAILSVVSFWHPARCAHLGNLAVALALVAYGRFSAAPPGPPSHQNYILVGILLLMFAIVPNHAGRPPVAWHQHGLAASGEPTSGRSA